MRTLSYGIGHPQSNELSSGESAVHQQFWQEAYRAAMLQTDAEKAQQQAECARKAIEQRVAELTHDPSWIPNECERLQEALRYLSLLLDCSKKEGGHLLWC